MARGRNAFRRSVVLSRGKAVSCFSAFSWHGTEKVRPYISQVQSDLQNEGRIRKEVFVRETEEGQWEHGKDLIRSHCIYSLGCSGDLREAAGSPTETGLQNCLHYACSCHPLKMLTFLTPNDCVITFISALTPALMDFLSFQL